MQQDKFDFESLFKEVKPLEEVELDLPSKNKFYKVEKIRLRPMTFEDEKALVSAKKSNLDSVNELLQRCITNFDVKELFIMDKLVILMKLREISYREDYDVLLGCQSCGKENKLTFKLDQLKVNYISDDTPEIREIELPKTKVKAKIRLPKVKDEAFYKNENLLIDNLWRFVHSVNDSDDPTIISKFVKDPRLPLQDMHILMESIFKSDFGLDTKIKFTCDGCSYTNISDLPITSNFFTMS